MSYVIRFHWPRDPDRVGYEDESKYGIATHIEDARTYLNRHEVNKRLPAYRDAYLIWGITTSVEEV